MQRLAAGLALLLPLCGVPTGPASADDDPYAGVRQQLKLCTTCHGERGASTLPEYPILAGQHMYYTYVQLKDFKAGRRKDPVMTPIAEQLDKEQMRLIATYFSEQPWPKTDYKVLPEQRRKAELMDGSAACTACHLAGYRGNGRVPRLGGQHPDYLLKTMLDFKHRRRTNAPFMNSLMETFDEDSIRAMAAYAASLHD